MAEQQRQPGGQWGAAAQCDDVALKLSHHAQARAAQRWLSTTVILYTRWHDGNQNRAGSWST